MHYILGLLVIIITKQNHLRILGISAYILPNLFAIIRSKSFRFFKNSRLGIVIQLLQCYLFVQVFICLHLQPILKILIPSPSNQPILCCQ